MGVRTLAQRLGALLGALPVWVLPSGFVLLGIWELVEWMGDPRNSRLFLAVGWIVLGLIPWLRLTYLRRRLSYLKQISDALKQRIEARQAAPDQPSSAPTQKEGSGGQSRVAGGSGARR